MVEFQEHPIVLWQKRVRLGLHKLATKRAKIWVRQCRQSLCIVTDVEHSRIQAHKNNWAASTSKIHPKTPDRRRPAGAPKRGTG